MNSLTFWLRSLILMSIIIVLAMYVGQANETTLCQTTSSIKQIEQDYK